MLRTVPAEPIWHVYHRDYAATAANPNSLARLALVGTHGMFYAADTIDAALWEVVLRDVRPVGDVVTVLPKFVERMDVIRLRPRVDLPLLELGQPGLRRLFADPASPPALAVGELLRSAQHAPTHPEARGLLRDLNAVGMPHMPVLSWPSRMHHAGTVYLAYAPPMTADWWAPDCDPLQLDTAAGEAVIDAVLARAGFQRHPGFASAYTNADPNMDDAQ